jgi:hypothetical protein
MLYPTSLNHQMTYGNGQAGDLLSEITRHLYNRETKAGQCGDTLGPYPIFSYFHVVTRITKAPICKDCLKIYND